jgi:polyisoprenoid-binding protein YceI
MSTMATTTLLPAGSWSVDPDRSRIEFQIKQFGIAKVRGAFTALEGTLDVGDDARVRGSVSVASIDTGNHRRDAHLRSAEFLDAERFPTLSFESHAIEERDATTFVIIGDLAMHGVTREIALTAELPGAETERFTLVVRGRVNRRDYGITPSAVLDAVVSDHVELELSLSAVKQA